MTFIVPYRILGPEDHAMVLHGQGRGTVTIAQRINGRWTERNVHLDDVGYVTRQLAGETDVYLSQNRFFGWHPKNLFCDK